MRAEPKHRSAAIRPPDGLPTLNDVLRRRAAEQPERVGYTFLADGETESERLTYGELETRARAVAVALRERAAPGDRAVLLFPPGLDFVAGFFGCLYAGVVAVPLVPPSFRKGASRLHEVLDDCSPRVVLTTSTLAGRADAADAEEWTEASWLALDGIDDGAGDDWADPGAGPETVAFLQYTSGSTGEPKGVVVTHGNLAHNEEAIRTTFGQDEGSRIVGWLPLYHDMGLIGNVLQPLWVGAPCTLMAPVSFLQRPRRWLEAISRYRATTSGGPNFAYDLCVRKVPPGEREGLDLSCWEVAFNGAEPVRAATLERFAEAFSGAGFSRCAFSPCYGLAEATLLVSGKSHREAHRTLSLDAGALGRHEVAGAGDREAEVVLTGSGAPATDQDVLVVVPETRRAAAPDRVGEIWVRGPSVARGYWGRADASEETFSAHLAGGEGPFLRTGDLGFLADGELFVTGRLKDLIILRGRNLYPHDIETTVDGCHPSLRPGCAAAFSRDEDGEERLVVVQELEPRTRKIDPAAAEEVAEAVRRAVADEHEAQVHELVLIRAGALPKTTSGKIRRRACRERLLAGELPVLARSRLGAGADVARRTATVTGPDPVELRALAPAERTAVLAAWLESACARILGVDVDPNRPLPALGLDSLAAIELGHEIETAVGAAPSLSEFLAGATVAGLAADLARRVGRTVPAATAAGPEAEELESGDHAASCGQESLWFLERLAPGSGAYHLTGAARIAPPLDRGAFERALRRLSARHAVLRTVLTVDGDRLVQRVLPKLAPEVAWEEAPETSETEARERLAEILGRPFDLERGPLLRACGLSRPDGEHLVGLALHHVAADFWSVGVLIRELGALYREETGGPHARLPRLGARYTGYARRQAAWLKSPQGERSGLWWRERLAGAPVLDLPTDRPRPPVQTYRGGVRRSRLPAPLAGDLRALARRREATLYMVCLAAFQALLHRYSGQEDLVVGSPSAGRASVALADVVGYFVNPLPLRTDLSGDPPFTELLTRVRQTSLAAFEHQAYPFARLAESLEAERDPARSPVFQVLFVLQKAARAEEQALAAFALGESGVTLDVGGLRAESLPRLRPAAQLDLGLAAASLDGGVALALEYNADLFEDETAGRMLRHLETLLRGAVTSPRASLAALPLLSSEEREELIRAGEGPAAEPSAGACLHDLVAAQIRRTPDAVAVVGGDERLTYAELGSRAGRLAARLAALGVGPEVTVAVAGRRTPSLVVAILGVLKAGGAYVPLDPDYPAERLAFMLEDSGASALVTEEALLAALPPFTGPVVLLDRPPETAAAAAARRPAPGNLAYLIYTSGSTGRPKGVAIEHRSAVALLGWARRIVSGAELAGMLASTSICFDLSVFELFAPLAAGGRVILAANALELPRLGAAGEVTLVNTVPSAIAEVVSRGGIPASVRTVCLAGEPLLGPLVRRIEETGTVERVLNLYGPSEDTTYSTWAEARGHGRPPTIGRPVAGTRAHALDRRLEPVPQGVVGELHLAGAGLARGYLCRPGLTAERFLPDPWSALAGAPGTRLYRTGDLVRRRPDGELEFLGRGDHQVKIRGFRVELGEVEAVLARHPAVRQAAALALRDGEGDDARLVAWVAAPGAGEGLRNELSKLLAESLPQAFQPRALVVLDALPRTPSGKVDLRALPAPAFGAGPEAAFERPRGPVEEVLSEILADVLGIGRIGRDDDFFVAGGHSLLAARALGRIERAFGTELPLVTLFQTPTVAELAERIAGAGSAAAPAPLTAVPRGEPLPLSPAQERLWFLHRLEPASPAYHVPGAVEIDGELRPEVLAASLLEIVRRHEVLRSSFPSPGGKPVQEVRPAPRHAALPRIDLDALPEARRDAEGARLCRTLARRPFDLASGPLVRWSLLRLAPAKHRLAVVFHHAVSDGASFEIFLRELGELYDAFAAGRPSPLPEPPVQYGDFAAWQRRILSEEALREPLAWWREQLTGMPVLDLPTDRPRRPGFDDRGEARPFDLSAAGALKPLCREEGATLYMGLLAAFALVLARLAHQDDVPVGTPVSTRKPVETEELIGLFVNTLVLRTRIEGRPTGRELLRRIRTLVLEAHARAEVPFERVVEELQPERLLDHAPLFQTMLTFLPTGPGRLAVGDLELRFLDVATGTSKFDLSLWARQRGERLDGHLVYRGDLWDASTMARLERYLQALVRGLASEPDRPVADLPLLCAGERHQLLVETNATAAPAPAGRCLHEILAERAAATPDAPALLAGGALLSFRELSRRVNRTARRLRELGVGPEAIVGVCADRSPEMVVALLAAWQAGGAYLPLDPSHPRDRLAGMLEDAGAQVLLTRPALLAAPDGAAVVPYEELERPGGPADDRALEGTAHPDGLAYVLYTSGSTGRPKGTLVSHRSVVNLTFALRHAIYRRLAGPLRVGLNSSLAFDASVKQLVQLLDGHALSIVPDDVRLDGRRLIAHVRERSLEVLDCTPSQLRLVLEAAAETGPEDGGLPLFLVGGEAIDEPLWRDLAELFERGGAGSWNVYGPTECTVDTTVRPIRGPRPLLGGPIANVRTHVLDGALRPVPAGVVGELCVGGAGLARGYRHQPGRTALRFVPDPFGAAPGDRLYRTGDLARRLPRGDLEFAGREDGQVKVRGHRVELGEIESILAGHPQVTQAVVLLRDAAGGEGRLVAYTVGPGEPSGDELRSFLARQLPGPMLPAWFIRLERLPLAPGGKVDHRALPEPGEGAVREVVPPRTPVEERLAEIWRSLLHVEAVDVRDDFFALGGHSLLVAQLASRVRQTFGVEVPLRAVFEAPTLEGLAATIEPLLGSMNPNAAPPPAPRSAPIRRQARGRGSLSRLLEEVEELPARQTRERLRSQECPSSRRSP